MDSSHFYSDAIDTPHLSPAFNSKTSENNTSYKRFFTFLRMDLARWLSSWAFWGNLIVGEIFSLLLIVLSVSYSSTDSTNNRFVTMYGLTTPMIYTNLAIVILSGIIAGKDYSFKFATPLRSLFKYPLSFMGARLYVISIIATIYSLIIYGSSLIGVQALMYASQRTFDPSIPWWQYLFTSILFLIFFALCCAGITIIFRSTAVGIILSYIIVIILPQFSGYIQEKFHFHLSAFMLATAQANSQLNYPPAPPTAFRLTYWENVGVGVLWAVVFIGLACLAVAFWKNREIPPIFHKKQKNR